MAPLGASGWSIPVGGVDMFFVRVNQVLVRRWTCLVAMSDRLIPLAFAQEGSPATRSGSRSFGSARFGSAMRKLRVARVGTRGPCCVLS